MIENVSIIITTFDRPRSLNTLLRSIKEHLPVPSRNVLIVNNGQEPISRQYGRVINLPYDAGISACRNAGIAECATQWALIMEDDFCAHAETSIQAMIDTAHRGKACVVGGKVLKPTGEHIKYEFTHKLDEGALHLYPIDYNLPCPPCGVISNYMLIEREAAIACPWDNEQKVIEHLDFFLSASQAGLKVAWCSDSSILHRKFSGPGMNRKEGSNTTFYWNRFFTKWGIDKIESHPA